jgi:hypothetical protein
MKSAEIERDLLSLEQQHDADRQQLDLMVEAVRPGLQKESAAWITREVARRVESHPDVVNALGIDRLREFKGKVAALIDSLPEIVVAEGSKKEEWPHNSAQLGQVDSPGGESYFAAVFRGIVSKLGPILDGYGLLTEPDGHYSSWSKSGKAIRYQIHTGFGSQQIQAIIAYYQEYRKFQSSETEIRHLRKALTEAKARSLTG